MSAVIFTEIGARIRKQREYLRLTREELAELLDVTPKFCSDIELGVKGMSIQTLCKISDTLKISTDYILKGADNEADITEIAEIVRMLLSCEPKKLKVAEKLLKVYLLS